MAEIKITVPDNQENRVLQAFAGLYGYQNKLEDGSDNPQSKKQFVKAHISSHIQGVVSQWEAQEAEAARVKNSLDLS